MKYPELVKAIEVANRHLLYRATTTINRALVVRNWIIGNYIVQFQQGGQERAKYGERLLSRLAEDLAARGLRGLDERTLRDCRLLFQVYPQIRGTVSPEFWELAAVPSGLLSEPRSSGPSELAASNSKIRGTPSPKLPAPLSCQALAQLSWSKLQELIRLEDPCKRAFYENECLKGNWAVRQLQRQIGSLLYERTGLSRNMHAVVARAHRQEPPETIEEIIRDPYVLEFTGLADRPDFHESTLEKALLDDLQTFLLELGTGFCFEARQFRVTVGNDHDYLDLVFYHRLLRCHVLMDLKIRAFKHADGLWTSSGRCD